jgi:hypothetical protein
VNPDDEDPDFPPDFDEDDFVADDACDECGHRHSGACDETDGQGNVL